MGQSSSQIDERTADFIRTQHLFFVATAPLDPDGHVNLSPKGHDSFRILGPTSVAYLDMVGSGIETVAHLKENGRIVLMFCAFQGTPNVVRIHGYGRAVEPHDEEFAGLSAQFSHYEGTRSIIVVEVTRVSDSCGYSVPLMKYEGERTQLLAWCRKKGPEGLKAYQQQKNRQSIDGLPGLNQSIWPGGRNGEIE